MIIKLKSHVMTIYLILRYGIDGAKKRADEYYRSSEEKLNRLKEENRQLEAEVEKIRKMFSKQ